MAWADIVARREARPALLGLELEPFPYASAFSLLFRISRITALDPKEWFQSVGLNYHPGAVDLAALRAGRASRRRFESALGLAQTEVPKWWAAETWSPMRTGGALDRVFRSIRGCPRCAEYGYHTSLFQLPSIAQCPWHRSPLIESCPTCEKPAFTLIDSEGRVGACECGLGYLEIDHATIGMNTFPSTDAEVWLSAYLAWVGEQRKIRYFIASEWPEGWLDGFAKLAEIPRELSLASGVPSTDEVRVERIIETSGEDPEARDFWGWGALADQHPLTFVPLPAGMHEELETVARQVMSALPPHARDAIELVAAEGADEHETPGGPTPRRPELFIPPHSRSSDGTSWLNLSAVDVKTLQLCGKLVDRIVDLCDPSPVEADFSRQTARTHALSRISGRRHLAQALRFILLQGYRQGLDAILRASLGVPGPEVWWLPVAEVVGERGTLLEARVCWVRVPPPRLRRSTNPPPDPGPASPMAPNRRRAFKRRTSQRKGNP